MRDLFNALPFELPDNAELQVHRNESNGAYEITGLGAKLSFHEACVPAAECASAMNHLLSNSEGLGVDQDWNTLSRDRFDAIQFTGANWRQESVRLFGKEHPLPRLTAWHGDSDAKYSYSKGISQPPAKWTPAIEGLRAVAERLAKHRFNSVLLNWYRGGSDHLGWHADDERELGPHPIIASINLGASRDFDLRLNSDHSVKMRFRLGQGSALIMSGRTQDEWQHCVPKRKKARGSRINLTFRSVVSS